MVSPVISIIIPVYNGELWIDKCFESIYKQDVLKNIPIEVSVFDDCSNDATPLLLDKWHKEVSSTNLFTMTISRSSHNQPKGVGFAKNAAVKNSSGHYLCFQDIDDEMAPHRLASQLAVAEKHENSIVGSQFTRSPADATARFTKWANNLSENLLDVQVYTSHGPTVIMPTWFCARGIFDRVGGFCEDGAGTPEDLIFFYHHLDAGGTICRVNMPLVIYRYHPAATTFSISKKAIWDIRMTRLETKVLSKWVKFTVWNGGKQGRQFWRSLSSESRAKVVCFCDVDPRKIGTSYVPFLDRKVGDPPKVPIRHFRDCSPPFVICMKMDLTSGAFEQNLASLNLTEGIDFVMFS